MGSYDVAEKTQHARLSRVELRYVDTTVDAARLEARATWSPQCEKGG